MRLSSLKSKFLIITIGSIFLLGFFLIILVKSTLNEKLTHELQKKGLFMSHHLSDMTERLILTDNIILLNTMIDDFLTTDSDLIYIYIVDGDNKVIAHTFSDGFPTDLLSAHVLTDMDMTGIKHIRTGDGDILDIAHPIINGDAGICHIGISESGISNSVKSIIATIIKIIASALILAGIVTITLTSRVTRALPELVDASSSIGKGNLSVRVKTRTNDELGLLAETFNSMADSLQRSRDELINANEWLEEEIRERKNAEKNLGISLTFLNSVFDSIRDPFMILDDKFTITMANEEYARLKGMTPEELNGNKCFKALHGTDRVCDDCVVQKTFISKDPCVKEKEATLPDGTSAWLELYTYPVTDESGTVKHVLEYTRNITERKKAEAEKKALIDKLEDLSMTDELTGLLNRRALIDVLDLSLKGSDRYEHDIALMLCDLDNLKSINDTYGHISGDMAIKTASKVLREALRSSDIIGRYGGDEFLVILPETDVKGAEDLAERIRAMMERTAVPLDDGSHINITMSIGVADNSDAHSTDKLITIADEAMYSSKKAGRNRIFTFGT